MAAYTAIDDSGLFMNTVLYTGNYSTNAITGVGFQPDLVWAKERDGTSSHAMFDAVRGVQEKIMPNSVDAESTETTYLSSFDSDGWTTLANNGINQSGILNVGWQWKANGSGSANTVGDIASTVSANTTSGFAIVKYTGTYLNNTVGHGIGAVPKMIITKRLDDAENWKTYHVETGNDEKLQFDEQTASSSFDGWNDTTPTSTVFSLGQNNGVNGSGYDYVAYCFADVAGYSKFGGYQGNSSADGVFIYTGFRPSLVIVKRTDDVSDWQMQDSKRIGYNVNNYRLNANTSAAETASGVMDFVSNGFKFRGTPMNTSGGTFIYMAFGETFVNSNGVPCNAR